MPPTHGTTDGNALVTLAEVARRVGLTPAAVSNWRARYPDFPEPARTDDGTEYFRTATLLEWLQWRTVPASARRDAETSRTTYADRMREGQHPPTPAPSPVGNATPMAPDRFRTIDEMVDQLMGDIAPRTTDEVVHELMDDIAPRVSDTMPLPEYVMLASCLLVVRSHSEKWDDIRDATLNNPPQQLERLLSWIGQEAETAIGASSRPDGTSLLHGLAIGPTVFAWSVRTVERWQCEPTEPDDTPGNALRLLLERYARRSGRDSVDGEKVTPSSITSLAAKIAVTGKTPETAADPYCRTGEFLATLHEAVDDPQDRQRLRVRGAHPRTASLQLAQLTLGIRGMRGGVAAGTTHPWHERTTQQVDALLTNPPFNNRSTTTPEHPASDWFPFGTPPVGNDNLAWLQHAAHRLAPGGRAVVVMPDSAATATPTREQTLRAHLVDTGVVECVIALPRHLFFGTNIRVSLWVLRAAADSGTAREVLFINARGCGAMETRTLRVLGSGDVDAIAGEYRAWRNRDATAAYPDKPGWSAAVSPATIHERDNSLDPPSHVPAVPHQTESRLSVRNRSQVLHQAMGTAQEHDRSAAAALAPLLDQSDTAAPPRSGAEYPLENLCEIQVGPSNATLKKFRAEPSGENTESLRLIEPKSLQHRRVIPDEVDERPVNGRAFPDKYRIGAGDVLLVRTGSLGRVALTGDEQAQWGFGTNLIRLRPETGVDPGFLLAYLSLPETQEWLNQHASGSAVIAISRQALSRLRVRLPDHAEQQRVGSLLSALDTQAHTHYEAMRAAEDTHTAVASHLLGRA